MHRSLPILALLLLWIVLPASRVDAGNVEDRPAPRPFVVHEWGTFTSMQGSDGIALEGLQHEEEHLPSFVYSRTEVRECPLREFGYKGLEVPVRGVTRKMETPVLYFHTDVPRRVRVRVDFVNGLLTQWYPVTDELGPPEGAEEEGPLDLRSVSRSFLAWDLDLLPRKSAAPNEIPAVSADHIWSYAREVDAAYVRTQPRDGEKRMGPTEAEHYVFYRGLGTFDLPVEVQARKNGIAVVLNKGRLPIRAVYVVEADAEGRIRWKNLGSLDGGNGQKFQMERVAWQADASLLRAAYQKELIAEGLHADEARAMVRTWARQWFASEGTRVMYVVPRAFTDRLLPLTITPVPDETVRVLVGRLEFITPKVEADTERALTERLAHDPETRRAAEARLMRFGRFLEPHLRRAIARTDSAPVRKSAKELLADLAP